MEQTQRASERLAARAAREVETFWGQLQSGSISVELFRSLAATALIRANAAGVALADAGLAAELTRNISRPTRPLGIRPDSTQLDRRRVLAAIDRVLDEQLDTIEDAAEVAASRQVRLSALARSEPLLSVATAITVGMTRRGIPGWVRRTDSDPCSKCVEWADGIVRRPETPMARHKGCSCIQVPTTFPPGDQPAEPATQRDWVDWLSLIHI